ncbi:MAG TPA: hypothetical protein VM096_06415 [Vicinamibacterales bacterium]|nr:hypothetical protein [Vicinamibacterales bacterium]
MQDRRYRPGDVLDDYCPRERRITDHAIVAMIDDEIRRTRCGSCDAEHEYKDGKVPTPRRKTQPPALFTQVLDTMNGPVPQASAPHPAAAAVIDSQPAMMAAADPEPPAAVAAPKPDQDAAETHDTDHEQTGEPEPELEGGFRRSLIRATFPRPDGQAPPPRALPEFTIQSLNNRRNNNGQRHAGGGANKFRGGRRRPGGGGGSQDNLGPMRFRDHGSQQGERPQGQGQGPGQGGGRRRRGGKKNR